MAEPLHSPDLIEQNLKKLPSSPFLLGPALSGLTCTVLSVQLPKTGPDERTTMSFVF
jgi:hypothetical protein